MTGNFRYVYENDKTDNGPSEDDDDRNLVSGGETYQKNLQVTGGDNVSVAKKTLSHGSLG
ncbi:hypothetical protein OUZ56_007154 [Daphnia magna]|uniref:Uncharacterized protein n=1 Tax=Daphnia magna TaxID=35525 RepID=A0ABQ9YXQ9_9CRUS|nr:hypothetical protein OUZ56_007154 [Daphnia magna]